MSPLSAKRETPALRTTVPASNLEINCAGSPEGQKLLLEAQEELERLTTILRRTKNEIMLADRYGHIVYQSDQGEPRRTERRVGDTWKHTSKNVSRLTCLAGRRGYPVPTLAAPLSSPQTPHLAFI
jgi:hypothetical protein